MVKDLEFRTLRRGPSVEADLPLTLSPAERDPVLAIERQIQSELGLQKSLLTDRDWASIDGRLCLVTKFQPIARESSGWVESATEATLYGSVHMKCEDLTGDFTAVIRHRTDFAMLWAAFHQRMNVPGTRVTVRSRALNSNGLGENEEVWLVWTKRSYRAAAGLFGRFLPRLIVMVARKGAFDLVVDRTGRLLPELQGEARAAATLPLVTWIPEVMTLSSVGLRAPRPGEVDASQPVR